MRDPITIALDAMSGDRGAQVAVPAALQMLASRDRLRVMLVGIPDAIEEAVRASGGRIDDRLTIVPATQVVAMDERPADALRRKKDSSMRVAVDLVKRGDAQACVSAGNTGALVATARFVLKTLPGIDRPAIISQIPAIGGHTHMLDLGANAECTPEQLFQFAVMGTVVAADMHDIERPRVGLLNIGEEEIKGRAPIRQAAGLLAASTLNYIGFVEGDDIFSGRVDVVVSDGFTGNVALKTTEGAAGMVTTFIREEFTRSWLTRCATLLVRPLLKSLWRKLDPRRYNGASLVGLRGIVIKSHGRADVLALCNAIGTAVVEVDKGVPTQISKLLEEQVLEQAV